MTIYTLAAMAAIFIFAALTLWAIVVLKFRNFDFKIWLIVASFLSFVAPNVLEILGVAGGSPDASRALSYSFGIGFFVLSGWMELRSIQKKIENSRQSIENSLRNRREFTNEGDSWTAMKEITNRFGRAVIINNIYIPFASRPNIYHALLDKERIARINEFLGREDTQKYTEIISRDTYLSSGPGYQSMLKGPKGKMDIRVLNSVFPCLNFIIFEYPDSPSEVMFGWGGYANLNTAKVYSTSEADVVQMFQEMFSTLADVSGSVDDPTSIVGLLQKYIGIWIDVAIKYDGDGRCQIVRAAVLEFFMDQTSNKHGGGGRLALRGLAFSVVDGELHSALREIYSESCELHGDRVYVSHRVYNPNVSGSDHALFGQSMYDFGRFSTTGQMYGVIFDPGDEVEDDEKFLGTIARKLGGSIADAVRRIGLTLSRPEGTADLVAVLSKDFSHLIAYAENGAQRAETQRAVPSPAPRSPSPEEGGKPKRATRGGATGGQRTKRKPTAST